MGITRGKFILSIGIISICIKVGKVPLRTVSGILLTPHLRLMCVCSGNFTFVTRIIYIFFPFYKEKYFTNDFAYLCSLYIPIH